MIKKDFLIRMIQEIINSIVNALLNKKDFSEDESTKCNYLTKEILGFPIENFTNTSTEELIDLIEEDSNKIPKIELCAMTMLRMAEKETNLLLKSKLQQDGLTLLKYVDKESRSFSFQRTQLISLLESSL